MLNKIEISQEALTDALHLSQDILDDFELGRNRLENIYYKVSRLARLLNDFEMQRLIQFEISGYSHIGDKLPLEIYNLAVLTGRERIKKDTNGETIKSVVVASINLLETQVENDKIRLTVTNDPNVSISSANPNQYVWPTANNKDERERISNSIFNNTKVISTSKAFIHRYVLDKNLELKFSDISQDIFSRIRSKVDALIGNVLPDSIPKLTSIYNNLKSESNEDWSNAVHGCRRILADLADILFPAISTPRTKGKKTIELGQENYINRPPAGILVKKGHVQFLIPINSKL